ncbi:MAG: TenA family transcriptional regulator [Armatimonadota bacterium]|nr:TenA family transcriptional regulator [Armatimonadota bacterium]MDR7438344.1 TenA family transcriptional regulator [Armatimonadota bacterium]MDR7443334.1 TenA family transcriptional regulator [Armatimonadota bacterium]MDR7563390.1 TenA family transcriptional regulator [Armatimonadota bacterium]MDR7567135.1 TenA family transcriptional regulator [Armatimonadota bacterium]
MRLQALVEAVADRWQKATRHPFLAAVRDGTLPHQAFATWLVQDYHFVRELLPFQARLLAQAPRRDQAVLARGILALVEELEWFEEQAAKRGLLLQVPVHPICRSYVNFLWALSSGPYAAQIVSLWALERIYFEAWSGARPGAEPYREFVEHWTHPDFERYVQELLAAAEHALAEATPKEQEAVRDALTQTVEHEIRFWEMSWEVER